MCAPTIPKKLSEPSPLSVETTPHIRISMKENGWKIRFLTASFTGWQVPVNLKYTIGLGSLLGIYVAAGPDFFFDFKKKDYVDRKKAQVALNLGAGVKLLKHLQVGVTYQLPMGDSFTWKNAGDAIGAKNKTWQVSAAYLF